MTVMPPPSHQQLALLSDNELFDLAALWRKQAARGMRAAFGMAHALEVECRRRERERSAHAAPVVLHARAASRTWRDWLARLLPSGGDAGNKKGLGMSAESLASS